ncbi:signal recognition particle 19 kDa protein [Tetranychus urticae]|uniref:Signal recognition particle 19 kDa protein n=1 Tax=Tetranychus urticae TaxID=32264 RepID=T1KKD0_TETUR|nr:signal recognition particle 19 kDa protein [Tetranychus urticae]
MAEQIGEKNWLTVYPAYINSNRSRQRGRMVPKEKGVSDPRWQEIKDVLETIKGVQVKEEPNKVYPRELDKELMHCRGRVRYTLPGNDPRFKKRDDVLFYLCEMIPKLKSRTTKGNTAQTQSTEQSAVSGKKKKSRKN